MNTTDYILQCLDSQQYWVEEAMSRARLEFNTAYDVEQVRGGTWTEEEARVFLLSEALKCRLEDAIDDMPLDAWQDAFKAQLCRSAFEDINFQAMARHYLTKVEEDQPA